MESGGESLYNIDYKHQLRESGLYEYYKATRKSDGKVFIAKKNVMLYNNENAKLEFEQC